MVSNGFTEYLWSLVEFEGHEPQGGGGGGAVFRQDCQKRSRGMPSSPVRRHRQIVLEESFAGIEIHL